MTKAKAGSSRAAAVKPVYSCQHCKFTTKDRAAAVDHQVGSTDENGAHAHTITIALGDGQFQNLGEQLTPAERQ